MCKATWEHVFLLPLCVLFSVKEGNVTRYMVALQIQGTAPSPRGPWWRPYILERLFSRTKGVIQDMAGKRTHRHICPEGRWGLRGDFPRKCENISNHWLWVHRMLQLNGYLDWRAHKLRLMEDAMGRNERYKEVLLSCSVWASLGEFSSHLLSSSHKSKDEPVLNRLEGDGSMLFFPHLGNDQRWPI